MGAAQLTFEALVNAYSSDLYRYAYWLCKDRQLAEDLVQETFMRAWRALDKLDNPQSAKAWLFTILRRELSRHLGKVKQNELLLDNTADVIDALSERTELGKLEHWVLNRALKKVPSTYLEPLLLQVIAGYSCEEIGTIMGLNTGAVMTRVCRARQQLRSEMTNETDVKKRAGR